MIDKLLTEHLEFLSLKEAAEARLSLHLSKWHIIGNHMSRLKYTLIFSMGLCSVHLNSLSSEYKIRRASMR